MGNAESGFAGSPGLWPPGHCKRPICEHDLEQHGWFARRLFLIDEATGQHGGVVYVNKKTGTVRETWPEGVPHLYKEEGSFEDAKARRKEYNRRHGYKGRAGYWRRRSGERFNGDPCPGMGAWEYTGLSSWFPKRSEKKRRQSEEGRQTFSAALGDSK
jgi:hypothetical protein